MQVIRGLNKVIAFQRRGCVATIGKFDGMHRGHQALLNEIKAQAKKAQLPTLVMLFEPHPQEFFQPGKAPARLTRLREKLLYLQEQAIDYVLILPFNKKLAGLSAEDFIKSILINYLNVKHLIVGDDFRFGADRMGDFNLLSVYANQSKFTVKALPTLIIDNNRISSSALRQALTEANFKLAEAMLGRKFSLHGRVSHGDKLGRTLGFPTANIFLHRDKSPISGIFAVRILGVTDQPLLGVANIGTRPTVGGTRVLLEVYIFDFSQDIYGRQVTVEILHKFRDEERYDTLEALTAQIEQDVQAARVYFSHLKSEQ